MCGFSGFFGLGPFAPEASLHAMGEKLLHRGPDASGYWFDSAQGIGFSHQRLAVVDLSSAGSQPMHSEQGRYVIAFNGEIYNHADLRKALVNGQQAPQWRGHSDTETLLACFEAWGIEQTLRATVGMFAIALWDRQKLELTLARDRMGEKPLYWGWQGGYLLFGSELKALKAHPSFNAVISRAAVAALLRYNYIPAPLSIYEGIHKLKPGQYLTVRKGELSVEKLKVKSYWSFNQTVTDGQRNPFVGSDSEALKALESVLINSIQGQMISDVPLGAFLSGGVDSSMIVALMQKLSSRPVRTFTIGFDEVGFNEAEHANLVAEHLKTDHVELYVGAAEAMSVIERVPSIYCEPFADSSQIPTFLVSEMASKNVTVALSGDAGDELFGGYNPYRFVPQIWSALSKVPLGIRRPISRMSQYAPVSEKIKKFLAIADSPTKELLYRQLISHWKNPSSVVLGMVETETVVDSPDQWPDTGSFEEWMMSIDAQMYMVDDILVKVDRAAMANSLETRVPLLDHRVVELTCSLPLNLKIRNGTGKWLLRELLYRYVPKNLIERPKKGFSIPLAEWLRGPLREWAESLLDSKLLSHQGYFNSAEVQKIWRLHLSGRSDRSRQLWSILMFQAWHQEQMS
ncbi:asparagine synthase (glutamine-hydrolyzing) [Pseudomonas sp. KCJK8927]|uniref:asparagine synthase (glutamine-hydrolyzing) n=1 Tax=Pseudomonas sp. KCJK8927 TaxID=3344560 RepID=UPI003906B0EB